MPRVIGFAELPGLDPRSTFVGNSARIFKDAESLAGRVFLADVSDDVVVAAFEISDTDSTWDLVNTAGAGKLAARAEISERGGVTTVDAVHLMRWDVSTAWPDNMRMEESDVVRAVLDARDGRNTRRRLSVPSGARPMGEGPAALIDITGEIGVHAGDAIAAAVTRAEGKSINVAINSEGGNLLAAMSAYEALVGHCHRVSVEIIDRANSAASIIAMAGDVRTIDRHSVMMLHLPHGAVAEGGTAAHFRRMAKVCDDFADAMAAIYARRTRHSRDYAMAWMEDEVTFGAGEALRAGLANRISSDLAPPAGAGPAARRARFRAIRGPFTTITTTGWETR